jgi:glutamine synthetase
MYKAEHLERVPHTLGAAVDTFADSAFARESFGVDVVEHYAHFFRNEVAAYEATVTDWERRRYFEQI